MLSEGMNRLMQRSGREPWKGFDFISSVNIVLPNKKVVFLSYIAGGFSFFSIFFCTVFTILECKMDTVFHLRPTYLSDFVILLDTRYSDKIIEGKDILLSQHYMNGK